MLPRIDSIIDLAVLAWTCANASRREDTPDACCPGSVACQPGMEVSLRLMAGRGTRSTWPRRSSSAQLQAERASNMSGRAHAHALEHSFTMWAKKCLDRAPRFMTKLKY